MATGLFASAAHGATVTEAFTGGLGGFDATVGNTANGNNFGYSNTNFAGDTAGELGGTFARTNPDAYVADTSLGGNVDATKAFQFGGLLSLDNIDADGSLLWASSTLSPVLTMQTLPGSRLRSPLRRQG